MSAEFLAQCARLIQFQEDNKNKKWGEDEYAAVRHGFEKMAETCARSEKPNFGVIAHYLRVAASLMPDEKLDNSIIPEDVRFDSASLRDLYCKALEEIGDWNGLNHYCGGRIAHLKSWQGALIDPVRYADKSEAEYKYWSDKATAFRKQGDEVETKAIEEVICNCRKWLNTALIRKKWGPAELEDLKQRAQQLEARGIEQAKKDCKTPQMPLQHCVGVDDLVCDPTFLKAEQIGYISGGTLKGLRASDHPTFLAGFKKGDVVFDMKPMLFATFDNDTCNHCGAICVEEEKSRVVCDGPCKGKYFGVYCSENCKTADSLAHGMVCMEQSKAALDDITKNAEKVRGDHGAVQLAFQLYNKAVAWCRAQNKSPADFAVLNRLIKLGLESPPTMTEGIDMIHLTSLYFGAVTRCRINSFDPKHDFYLHIGLILGIIKCGVITAADRKLGPINLDPASDAGRLAESQHCGMGIYPAVVFARPSCMPSVRLQVGDGKVQLVATKDVMTEYNVNLCFSDPDQLSVKMRDEMCKHRRIYCVCSLCDAQRALTDEEQVGVMKRALVQKGLQRVAERTVKIQQMVEQAQMKAEDAAEAKEPARP